MGIVIDEQPTSKRARRYELVTAARGCDPGRRRCSPRASAASPCLLSFATARPLSPRAASKAGESATPAATPASKSGKRAYLELCGDPIKCGLCRGYGLEWLGRRWSTPERVCYGM